VYLDRNASSRIFSEEMSGPTGLVSALWSDLKESKSYFLAGEGGSQGVNSQRCGEIKTIEVGGG